MAPLVTIFGSSRPQPGSDEYSFAYETGKALAAGGFSVCNGGYGGTMEAAARGAREAGGHTVGVTTRIFQRTANQWIEKEIRTETMVERLLKLIELGEAYVVLRGGTGTMLELAAVWEFVNKGVIPGKAIVAAGPFWDPVIETVERELLLDGGTAPRVRRVTTPAECVAALRNALGIRKDVS